MLSKPLTTAAPLLLALAACNGLTGIDNLSVNGGNGGASAGNGATTGPGSGTGAGNGPSATTGTGSGAGTTAATTGSGAGGSSTNPLGPATGVTITEVALYQGPKLLLMGGTETGTVKVPVVAGRDALFRVFVTTDGTYDKGPVTGLLYLGQGSQPIQVTGTLAAASTEGDLTSTVNFDVPGASLPSGVTYRIELTEPNSKSTSTTSSYPATGFAPLGAVSDGAQIKVTVVPVQYGADGSNRLPDTSATQLQGYHDAFFAAYPVDAVNITVRAPFAWTEAVTADGTGWSDLLDAIANLRMSDGAASDVYYFAAFQPGASFDSFCASGCVAGLGLIADSATDTYSHAAIGLGFTDPSAFTTIIHEIGHTQGRYHAPCGGAQNVDPSFPYSTGDIGDWGYDLVHKTLLQPGKASDMMGYCDPVWISDYTFNAIFERIQAVNGAEFIFPPGDMDRVWERARVDMQGNLVRLPSLQLHTPPVATATPVTVQTAAGSATVTGQYFSYDHIPGGLLFWPAGSSPATGVQVSIGGKALSL